MKIIVIGSANCLKADYDKTIDAGFRYDVVVACNQAGRDFQGELDHWCSLHPEMFSSWRTGRKEQGLPEAKNYWGGKSCPPLPDVKRGRVGKGSSGGLALDVALSLNPTHVILCGITLSPEYNHFNIDGPWHDAKAYRAIWEETFGQHKPLIRSWNGWTRDFFGEPTEKWLAANKHRAFTS